MCGSCASPWGACGCDGGSTLGMCACSKGIECPNCGHYPNKKMTPEEFASFKLADILKPEIVKRDREAFEAKNKH